MIGGCLWLDNRNFINAKVSQLDEAINQAFPTTDKLTGIGVAWEHQYNLKKLIYSRLWVIDLDIESSDIGAAVGIQFHTYYMFA